MKNKKGESHVVTEKLLWNLNNFFPALIIGIIFITIFLIILFFFKPEFSTSLILMTSLIVIYAIILFFMLEPKILREIRQISFKTIEKEVPVVEQVIHEIEKPIYIISEKDQEKDKEKEPIILERPKDKLNIPKYSYVGSSSTKIYHKKSCRLSKSIKQKYRINSNNPLFFSRKGYKACKVCILKAKKV